VLFVGNSHTYTHDMPQMVVKLAAAAEEPRGLAVALEVAAGATLAQHLSGGKVHERLSKERWDYVVLQEQQQISSYTFNPKLLEREFIAPGRTLDILARAASAKTILYMTAARRAGDAGHVAKDDYEQMQERSRVGYMRLAHETGALVAPVGLAWRWARNRRPQLPLWANDGYHPSLHGSYLAACVFYGLLYDRAALDNPFTAGLPAEEAGFLQRAADVARHL
jgi:hypothetical protein